jgi:hypothetical protein
VQRRDDGSGAPPPVDLVDDEEAGVIEIVEEMRAADDPRELMGAADVAAALVTDDVCDVLVLQRGWSFDAYEDWLAETLALHLLR